MMRKYWREIIISVLVFVCIVLVMSTTCTRQKLDIAENNIQALNDSVRTYQLKNGELLSAKKTLIIEKNLLETYLDISKKDIRDLEKKLKSQVEYIGKLEQSIKVDTIVMHDSIIVESDTTKIYFNYDDDWLNMSGLTWLSKYDYGTTLNTLSMKTPLTIGLTEDNQFFVTTPNPYISFTDINGAKVLETTRQKRWGIGPYLGFGVNVSYGAGLTNTQWLVNKPHIGFGFEIGIGVSYQIWQF